MITVLQSESCRRTAAFSLLFLALTAPVWAGSDYSTPYSFTTIAGAASIGSSDGPGSVARFYSPRGIAVDSAGNV